MKRIAVCRKSLKWIASCRKSLQLCNVPACCSCSKRRQAQCSITYFTLCFPLPALFLSVEVLQNGLQLAPFNLLQPLRALSYELDGVGAPVGEKFSGGVAIASQNTVRTSVDENSSGNVPHASQALDAVVLAPSSPINTEEYYKLWKNSQASYRSWASKGIDLSCAKAYESCTLSSNVGIFNI